MVWTKYGLVFKWKHTNYTIRIESTMKVKVYLSKWKEFTNNFTHWGDYSRDIIAKSSKKMKKKSWIW